MARARTVKASAWTGESTGGFVSLGVGNPRVGPSGWFGGAAPLSNGPVHHAVLGADSSNFEFGRGGGLYELLWYSGRTVKSNGLPGSLDKPQPFPGDWGF